MAGIGEVCDQQATKKLKLNDGHVSSVGVKPLSGGPPFSDDETIKPDSDDGHKINSDTDEEMSYAESEEARAEYDLKIKTSGRFDVDEVKGFVGMIFAMDLEVQPGIYLVVKELSQMTINMYNKDNVVHIKTSRTLGSYVSRDHAPCAKFGHILSESTDAKIHDFIKSDL